MKTPPNSANNTRQRAILSPDATLQSPDDKEDDGGALDGTSFRPGYRAADGVAVVVEMGVPTYIPSRHFVVHLGPSS